MAKKSTASRYFPRSSMLLSEMEGASTAGAIESLFRLKEEYEKVFLDELREGSTSGDFESLFAEYNPLDERKVAAETPYRSMLLEKLIKKEIEEAGGGE